MEASQLIELHSELSRLNQQLDTVSQDIIRITAGLAEIVTKDNALNERLLAAKNKAQHPGPHLLVLRGLMLDRAKLHEEMAGRADEAARLHSRQAEICLAMLTPETPSTEQPL